MCLFINVKMFSRAIKSRLFNVEKFFKAACCRIEREKKGKEKWEIPQRRTMKETINQVSFRRWKSESRAFLLQRNKAEAENSLSSTFSFGGKEIDLIFPPIKATIEAS